jgi:hypothetical protein
MNVKFINFPLQQWLHERPSMLRYTRIACLVYFCQCCRKTILREQTEQMSCKAICIKHYEFVCLSLSKVSGMKILSFLHRFQYIYICFLTGPPPPAIFFIIA